jgi:hypothetical protein
METTYDMSQSYFELIFLKLYSIVMKTVHSLYENCLKTLSFVIEIVYISTYSVKP